MGRTLQLAIAGNPISHANLITLTMIMLHRAQPRLHLKSVVTPGLLGTSISSHTAARHRSGHPEVPVNAILQTEPSPIIDWLHNKYMVFDGLFLFDTVWHYNQLAVE